MDTYIMSQAEMEWWVLAETWKMRQNKRAVLRYRAQRRADDSGEDVEVFTDDGRPLGIVVTPRIRPREDDPRQPQRPMDATGANWAVCRDCGREAHKIVLIRHRKECPTRITTR